jgi:hypothetical protein
MVQGQTGKGAASEAQRGAIGQSRTFSQRQGWVGAGACGLVSIIAGPVGVTK